MMIVGLANFVMERSGGLRTALRAGPTGPCVRDLRVRFDASASGPTLSGASRRYPGPDKSSHAAHILPEAGLKLWSDRTARRRLQAWQPIMNPAE